MTKSDSVVLKGVAIITMIFTHLFNQTENLALCNDLLYVGATPLVQLLAGPALRIPIYLFITGYGLYLAQESGSKTKSIYRVSALYLHFWIIFAIFIPLGCLLFSPTYLGSLYVFVNNLIGFNTTYNAEWWFIFPYVLLVLSSKWLLGVIKRYDYKLIIVALGLIYGLSFVVLKFKGEYLYSNYVLYQPLIYLTTLFSFGVGAVAAKQRWFSLLQELLPSAQPLRQGLILSVLLGVLTFRIFFVSVTIFDPLVAFISIFCIVCASRWRWLDYLLSAVGQQSTNMWLTHSFFCYYFFREFIYGFGHPAVIFGVTVLLSYVAGRLIDLVNKPAQAQLKRMFAQRVALTLK